MISRLRARHRWMWVALVIVAPVVIAAAMSVRRGEVVRQAIGPMMTNETPFGEWIDSWLEPSRGLREITVNDPSKFFPLQARITRVGVAVVDLETSWLPPFGEDVLVYWCDRPSSAAELPADAVLLGAWPEGGVARCPFPWSSTSGPSSPTMLYWYSLTRAEVVRSQVVDRLEVVFHN